ncbi:MAG: GatB/YqeY domain-containing protein [Steroidobacteraceae bacterium]
MTLKARIQEDVKTAMKSGAKERLATLRLISSAIKQREVDERIELDDAQVLSVIEKMVKQRRESIAQFEAGNRPDLVAKENAELTVITGYLPAQLSDAELDALIGAAIASTGAASIKDMGKVMGIIKTQAAGRADMAVVGARIKARLS